MGRGVDHRGRWPMGVHSWDRQAAGSPVVSQRSLGRIWGNGDPGQRRADFVWQGTAAG